MARLSPQKKRRVKRRAEVEVRREFAGSAAGARAAIGQANRDYGREVSDAQGAQRAYQSAINRMLGSLGGSGMGGRYANQLRKDLTLRKAESAAGVPYAVAQAQQRRSDAVASARADMASTQADFQSAVGKRTNDLLESARKNKAQRIDDRRDAMKDAEKDMRGVRNAMVVARTYLNNSQGAERTALIRDLDGFATAVAKDAEGADLVDARKAVARLVRRTERKAARGAFESVYGRQEWPQRKRRRR